MDDPILYWDDIDVGRAFDLGPHTVELDEIISFARRYDPQPFHIDEEAARDSIYGGIIASGWHTAAIAQRLLVDGFLRRATSLGSPGIEALRWRRPVRPGDKLMLHLRVVAKNPSVKHDDWGSIDVDHTIKNQTGETVMTYRARVMLARRGPADG
jgi:acyl dehydratase